MRDLLWTQAAATLALAGLIWTIQLVHYPLMAEVGAGLVRYHERHCARIAWLVAPLMGLEAVTAAALLWERPPDLSAGAARAGFALVAVAWLATGLWSVPEHARIAAGAGVPAVRRLVRRNWVRTAAWSLRVPLVLWPLHPLAGA